MTDYFPSQAQSVEAWLSEIKMDRYKDNFASAGINEVRRLKELTHAELEGCGVSVFGHRKRLLKAAAALRDTADLAVDPNSMEVDAEEGKMAEVTSDGAAQPRDDNEKAKFNSTSSLYIQSTIIRPDEDEIIFCVSVVMHDWIEDGEKAETPHNSHFDYFSEENNPMYMGRQESVDCNGREESRLGGKRRRWDVPTDNTIYQTLKSMHSCAQFSIECFVIALIYIERLITLTAMPVKVTNWRPLVLASLLVAQKVWDDRSLWNVDFSLFCPMFSLKEINHLEKKMLELLQFNVTISSSLYTNYYFQLRTLCQCDGGKAPANSGVRPLDKSQAKMLEARSSEKTEKMQKEFKGKSAPIGRGLNVSGNALCNRHILS